MAECCPYRECMLCAVKSSPNPAAAKARLVKLLKELPLLEGEEQVSLVRGIWSSAMAHPDDATVVNAGALESMVALAWKGIRRGASWGPLPYYAAHSVGSYTMNMEAFAIRAVQAGAVAAMAELLAGQLTWVEQRAAARTLSHLASYDSTFQAVAAYGEASCGVLRLAMRLAMAAPYVVYDQFVGKPEPRRLRYHRELLARGAGCNPGGAEDRKAEEWARQLQCWSLQVVNCFAVKGGGFLAEICSRRKFLDQLPAMWGGRSSPAGVGLLRTICYHKVGRAAVARRAKVVRALCNVARSSDDWQYMAVDSLLWLLQDPHTRPKVVERSVLALSDLVEISRLGEQERAGKMVMDVLLLVRRDKGQKSKVVSDALEDVARHRKKITAEKLMTKADIQIKRAASLVLRLEGNARFSSGDIEGAVRKYNEALEVCPVKARKDRITILNNRAECRLITGDAEKVVSDTSRAVCLCGGPGSKARRSFSAELASSLWRRALAYDALGMARDSLVDALVVTNIGCSFPETNDNGSGKSSSRNIYVDRLVKKQTRRTWLFKDAAKKRCRVDPAVNDRDEDTDLSEWETVSSEGGDQVGD